MKRPRTKVIAHRGFSEAYPENTMIAFKAAWEAGADGIEFDVQRTKDGHLVIIHDETVNRTTNGTGLISDMTLEEVKSLDAGTWKDQAFVGERIPTLEELFQEVTKREGHSQLSTSLMNVELKTGMVEYPGIEQQVVDLIRKWNVANKVIISSFNHYSLRTITQIAPDIPIGLLYVEGLVEPWHYAKRMKALAIHPFYKNIIPELVDGCRRAGVRLHPYTVDDEACMQNLVNLGANGIITNRPDMLRRIVDQTP